MNKLRVIVITQEDYFFLPKVIKKVYKYCDLIAIVILKHKYSLKSKKTDFLQWFGLRQAIKLSLLVISKEIKSILDNIFKFKLFGGESRIKDAAKYLNICYIETRNVNDIYFIDKLEKMQIDLIVSLSAPQKFKKELIKLPKYGAINLHGAYLPDYRGCFPSFWQLYNREEYAGATVHYIDENIDTGKIIIQEKVYIGDCKRVFDVIKKTKELGGELLIKALKAIQEGNLILKDNEPSKGRYYSWPTKEAASDFRRKGLLLI